MMSERNSTNVVQGKHSKAFRQILITETVPKIRGESLATKFRVVAGMHKIMYHYIPSFNYKRVNIPKPDGQDHYRYPCVESRILGK